MLLLQSFPSVQSHFLSTFSSRRKSQVNSPSSSSSSSYSYGIEGLRNDNLLILRSPLRLKPTRTWNDVTVKISQLNSPLGHLDFSSCNRRSWADMQQVIRATGTMLLAFLLGSEATIAGTLVAFLLVPMRSLGPDNWKIAAALMG